MVQQFIRGSPQESYLLDRVRNGEMPPGEHRVPLEKIAILEQWIAAGAKTLRPEPETIGPGLGISQEERDFWLFRPIDPPKLTVQEGQSAIDELLSRTGKLAPQANRRVLIIRAYFNLTGLPPSPEEVAQWTSDNRPDWFDQMLTQLLNSPHYGEQWGRHWLDLAGYADSEGYTVGDIERPWAWKYRDWVIEALNQDKPFDQFITEQLAGDELAGDINGDLTPAQIQLLTATGYLRMAADGTGNGADNPEGRNQTIADTIKIVGTSLLGLSLQCAQCHDHRYDPIPQTDYYAVRAIFEPALDWQSWKQPNARRVSLYTQVDKAKAAEVEQQAQLVAQEKAERLAEYMKQALDQELMKYEEPFRTQLREAYDTPANQRTEVHQQLLKQNPSLNITPGNLYQYIPDSRPKLQEFDKKIAEIRQQKPEEQFLRALVEPPNHTTETKLFHRGDFRQPKQAIAPGGLSVVDLDGFDIADNASGRPTTGRRLAFANWLFHDQNPIVARVIVNRVWQHHFGKGLVPTADYGKLGIEPEHPELIDYLADAFRREGWSLKKLHRMIMSSSTWKQTHTDDPDSRLPNPALQRLRAESIRDRMLAASGSLERKLGGRPISVKEDETGQVIVDGQQSRRSLYIKARRSQPVGMLQVFDAPVMETNCELRASSTVSTQSLMLLNGQFTLDQAAFLADRAQREPATVFVENLPDIAKPKSDQWSYGYGFYDQDTNTTTFTPLTHFTGTQWQGGQSLPDSKLGWVLLHASGGHPDSQTRAAIRRWKANRSGTIQISGNLSHPSESGDGVRGQIVSSRHGLQGEWKVHKNSTATTVTEMHLEAGDTIDFVTDSLESVTSDSFSWPVTLKVTSNENHSETIVSSETFQGPTESVESIPGQIVRSWELAYCRQPNHDELHLAIKFVSQQIQTLSEQPQAVPQGRTVIRQAMTNLCQSLISSNEFLYIE